MKKSEKIDDILYIISIILMVFVLVFKEYIGDLDELWQYNFIRNILNNNIPYLDFNMITTPFFQYIGALFLYIFGNNLITFRIYSCIIFILILKCTNKIFKILEVDNIKNKLYVILLYFMFYYDLGVEYNYLILLITLITLYLELKNNINKHNLNTEFKYNFLLACLMGFTILTKQTMGVILSLTFIFYKIIFVFNKKDYIKFLRLCLYRMCGIIFIVFILIILLIINNNLNSFFSYCILGVSGFSNFISYASLFFSKNFVIRFFAFILPLCILFNIKNIILQKNEILKILTCYSIAMFIGIYPIANTGHFIIYAYVSIILFLYNINNIKLIKNVDKKIINIIFKIAIILYILSNIYNLYKLYNSNFENQSKYYKGILCTKNLNNSINQITNYITEKQKENIEVKILDSSAILYMIPIEKYNKDYDMFNIGNFGYKGEERLIEEIKNAQNTQYLILNDKYNKNWQTPIDVIEFVKEKKEKIGEIYIFDIYK